MYMRTALTILPHRIVKAVRICIRGLALMQLKAAEDIPLAKGHESNAVMMVSGSNDAA